MIEGQEHYECASDDGRIHIAKVGSEGALCGREVLYGLDDLGDELAEANLNELGLFDPDWPRCEKCDELENIALGLDDDNREGLDYWDYGRGSK